MAAGTSIPTGSPIRARYALPAFTETMVPAALTVIMVASPRSSMA